MRLIGLLTLIWLNPMRHYLLLLSFLSVIIPASRAQKVTVSGYVTDAGSGESLIAANIYDKENPELGTSTNTYGFYSLSLDPGRHALVFSYLGYQTVEKQVDLTVDLRMNIELTSGIEVEEVVVTAKEEDRHVRSTDMGTVTLPTDPIKKIPAVFGEVDILKVLQLLPGVVSAGEGSSGFYVRGGGPDQNLVLLDEAVVYNSGHMLGFFSVFNADAIKNTTLIKGTMPAEYGGRLSSVLDVQMKEGNNQDYQIEGGIGLISSRVTVEGPIIKEKSSFLLSARRTYILDLAQPFIRNSSFAGTNYYFYDLNAKVNYIFSDKDRIYLSAYFGRDVLNFNANDRDFRFSMPYGNGTATLRWNHLVSQKMFFNLSLIYNDYDFTFSGAQEDFSFKLFSGVRDWNIKMDFDYFASGNHKLKWGLNYSYRKLTPNIVSASNGEVDFESGFVPKYGSDYAVYLQDEFKVNPWLTLQAGLRVSRFDQVGPYTSKIDSTEFQRLETVKSFYGLEPRLAFNVRLGEISSLKGGYSRTHQYLHLVSNSTSTLPTDIWVPSSEIVDPQISTQYALGYFRNFMDNRLETSIEIYYKDLENQIDYRETFTDNSSSEVENEFVFGSGRAYGAEFFIRKSEGLLSGWLGYTISRTERTFPDIEGGRTFPANYDRTHDLSLVLQYLLSPKWALSSAFVYSTGKTFTPIRSVFFIEQELNTRYGPRNSERLEPYHRVDLALQFTPRQGSERRYQSSWTFSVYNLYNRKNTFFIYTDYEIDLGGGTAKATAYKVSLFPVIPSVTWNFKWNPK